VKLQLLLQATDLWQGSRVLTLLHNIKGAAGQAVQSWIHIQHPETSYSFCRWYTSAVFRGASRILGVVALLILPMGLRHTSCLMLELAS
jgi:hypothetical protein